MGAMLNAAHLILIYCQVMVLPKIEHKKLGHKLV